MFERGKIDIAQPDVTMVGGLTELLRVSALPRQATVSDLPIYRILTLTNY